jgi:serine/threonine protein kinase
VAIGASVAQVGRVNPSDPASLNELNAALGGSYTLTRVLGEGGMAVVYLADDPKHGRQIALKVVKSHLASVDGAERFQAEIRTTAALNHPGILPLFDSGTVDGHAFYVMPVVEGESLQDRLEREGSLSPGESGRIVAAAARALDYAHRQGVVHRDIKPSNLLLHAGHTMVADFGISLLTGSASRLTATGMSLGTPHYMSPEQLDGSKDPDGRSDQYALGCVLFEMLEGHAPFPKRSAAAVLAAHLTQAVPSLSATGREARALDRVIQRAMAKDPDDRFATMTEMAEAVEAAIAPAPAPGGGERQGLVVLPFTNMSADPDDEYFSDGLTEEVIGDLSRMRGLRVISRTSAMQYKGTALRLPEIASELSVRYVLEGGVRKAGGRLRVSAQLIDAETEEHLWSDKYDGVMDDVFEIQDSVAASIARALSLVLTPEEKKAIQDRRMPDAEALEHYMRARQAVFTFDGERMREGIDALEPLLEEHGDHLQLLKGLAYLHWNMMNSAASTDPLHPKAVAEYAARLEGLDGGAPWAAAFLGMLEIFTDPVSGVLKLLDALDDLSAEPDMLWWAGGVLGIMGMPDLGEPFITELESIDPKSDYALFGEWAMSVYRGRWADAVRAVEAFPEHLEVNGLRAQMVGWTLGCAGDVEGAIASMEQTDFSALEGGFAFLGRILLATYRGERPLPEPDAVQREAAWRDWQYSSMMADVYAHAGEHEEALRWLSHAVEKGFYQARFMSELNAHLVDLRDDPRFKELVKQAQVGAARMRGLIEERSRGAG